MDSVSFRIIGLDKTGDIPIDGGHPYGDNSRRSAPNSKALGFHFFDLGTSSGVESARQIPRAGILAERETGRGGAPYRFDKEFA